jgi:GNAT superfamily N-acetyltransferase
MTRFIQAEDVLAIRNEVLREGRLTLDECRFPTDQMEGAFHLGYFENEQLVCIASFHPQQFGAYKGKGYQLRGMATIEDHRAKGVGKRLLRFAIDYLHSQDINYVWCNARTNAIKFYQAKGFQIISDEFEVPGIGPHRVLHLKLG